MEDAGCMYHGRKQLRLAVVLYWTVTICYYNQPTLALVLFLTATIDSKLVLRLAVLLFLTAKNY